MNRARVTLGLVLLAVGTGAGLACGDDHASVMRLEVQTRLGDCFATLATTTDPVDARLRDGSCKEGTSGASVAGTTNMRVLVDYGADFDDGKGAPVPTLKMFVDGIETPHNATAVSVGTSARKGYAFVFPTPAKAGSLSFSAASGEYRAELSAGLIASPALTIASPTCSLDAGRCEVVSGTGFLGLEVHFPGNLQQSIEIVSEVDGVEDPARVTVRTVANGDEVTATTQLPVPNGTLWRLSARALGLTSPQLSIALRQPAVTLSSICTGDGGACASFTSGVGAADFVVRVQGTRQQNVELVSEVDGLIQTLPVTKTDHVEGTEAVARSQLQIPFGTSWSLTARVGNSASNTLSFPLTKPLIKTSLACGASCALKAKDVTTLVIAAPRGIHAQAASVSILLGGAPVLVNGTVNLDTDDRENNQILGTLSITAPTPPNANTTLQIDVRVGGYSASTLLATVSP